MRMLLAALTCEKGDLAGNLAGHVALLHRARAEGCDLALFPEMSLTGSVDAVAHPERAVALDDEPVARLVAATGETGVDALFGLAERRGDELHITQVHAAGGRLRGEQRKRHVAPDEVGFAPGDESVTFTCGPVPVAVAICAESGFPGPWADAAAAGARLVCVASAPGLHGRRTDEAGWRRGHEWWEGEGLAHARAQARHHGLWVALATQAGSTADEDFPGLAALVAPTGEVVDRLPGWEPGVLVVDVPLGARASAGAVRQAPPPAPDRRGQEEHPGEDDAGGGLDSARRAPTGLHEGHGHDPEAGPHHQRREQGEGHRGPPPG